MNAIDTTVHVSGSHNCAKILADFKHQNGLHRIIAFSGGADSELNGVSKDDPLQKQHQEYAAALETRFIGEAIRKFQGFRIAILTGGTRWGVPNTATIEAKKCHLQTIGVFPLTGKKHALGNDILDLSICVEPFSGESRWGDESSVFTNLLDGVIVYGGGAGTLIECAHILKINEALLKSGTDFLKYIVPIAGTGGVADGLPFVWAKPEVRSRCMPNERVTNGDRAAEIIIEQLNLEDFYDPKF